MPAEMILNRSTQIAVINGKAYQAYAWYTDDDKPFFLAVAGKSPSAVAFKSVVATVIAALDNPPSQTTPGE